MTLSLTTVIDNMMAVMMSVASCPTCSRRSSPLAPLTSFLVLVGPRSARGCVCSNGLQLGCLHDLRQATSCPACSCTTASEAMESKPPSPTMALMNSDWTFTGKVQQAQDRAQWYESLCWKT